MRNARIIKTRLRKPKILFMDIETSPNLVYVWGCGQNLTVSSNQIVEERKIICISYAWEHEKKINTLAWDIHRQDDRPLLCKFSSILNKADIVIGHNSDQFDIKWIRGRLLYHNLTPATLITSIDTLKLAKKAFNLNSFSLNYLSQYLNLGSKNSIQFSDWVDIIRYKKKSALQKMVRYCEQDVRLLKKVFKKIKPYVTLPVHLYRFDSHVSPVCVSCGSSAIIGNGIRLTKIYAYKRLRCNNCGTSFSGPRVKKDWRLRLN